MIRSLYIIILFFPIVLYGQCLEGDCENNWGVIQNEIIKYQGNFKNGEYHGLGKVYKINYNKEGENLYSKEEKILLDGEFENGRIISGKSYNENEELEFDGRYSYSDGYRYYDEGKWYRDNQLIYHGEFLNGTLNGKGIRFNNTSTVEIDYSSLHVILAYAHVGIDYWENTDKDPYDIPVRGVNNPEHIRDITKLFFLLAFNASDETALYKAFRSELDYEKYPYSFPDKVLAELLQNIKQIHPDVAHMICTGAGLMLMNMDSKIAEYIIRDFVKTNTPILTVHDSFIVPVGQEDRLDNLMKEAFNDVTKKNKVKVKFNENITMRAINQYKFSTGPDRDYYLDSMKFIAEGNPSKGYQHRWDRHKKYFKVE